MSELEKYPMDDLINELRKRSVTSLMIMERKGLKQEGNVITKYWDGSLLRCLGLVEVIRDALMEEYRESYPSVSENDV